MAIYPVILCGGSGTRLWPASRPDRPKQFIDLLGGASLFQRTVERVLPLATDGRLIVVAGRAHRRLVLAQLSAMDADAVLILEPEARDSAPAMAAAATWIARADPDGVALFVASDHHIPDGEAFRRAVIEGAAAAETGRIVTFGVRPTEPSSAYGYIRPQGTGLSPVAAFVEKPDAATAERYVAEGYLWNSGNFVVLASTLIDALSAHAPQVIEAARASLGEARDEILLGDAFRRAPKISIDYAVMERSDRVSVLPVDFAWSDLGAWDAVAAADATGGHAPIGGVEGDGVFVRAAAGMVVATAGVSDLAIIAEPDTVLVCALDQAQAVKRLADAARDRLAAPPRPGLAERIDALDRWMRLAALPLWATLGVDPDGGFVESLDEAGVCAADFRRARVQTRQAYVFATAGRLGWSGPWARLVRDGLDRFDATNLRPDGLYRTRVSRRGAGLDDTASLYDQAFALLAFAAATEVGVDPDRMRASAQALRDALAGLRHPAGGWREAGAHPHQANAHMHLLEACLAWESLEPDGPWVQMADEIVALARSAFIDPAGGFLREFFEADWTPAPGADGEVVEPGHQFEWAWLLTRWGRARGDAWAQAAASWLYAAGARGVDHARGVVVDQLSPDLRMAADGAVRTARLWPQTERLKAALILGEDGDPLRLEDADDALAGLWRYLEPNGLWGDRMDEAGAVRPEPAPASSLYHIMAALDQALKTRPSA